MNDPDTSDDSSSCPDSEVVEWVANLAERVRAGESIDLEALAVEFPERAEVLRSLLPSMITLARYGRSRADQPRRNSFPGGRMTLGEFRFVREIGRGGMGVVYEALQTSVDRTVALKVLPLATAAESRHYERFKLEARAVASLRHEHIVPLYGVGCEDEIPFYAMQMIEGYSLAEVLRSMRKEEGVCLTDADDLDSAAREKAEDLAIPLTSEFPVADTSPAEPSNGEVVSTRPGLPMDDFSPRSRAYHRTVARLGSQAARALQHAHENRIIHRDIKPGNLLLDRRGHLWVTDFGLARVLDDATMTRTGDLIGTLRYMSPEQALGNRGGVDVDGRTDVYSLGITLYELLTLRPAFAGSNRADTLHAIGRLEPKAIRALSPSVPRDLETIVQKAMAKEARDRYQTAGDLADDLNRFLEGRTISARRRSLVDRTTKLANRNRPVVIATTVMIVLGMLSAAGELIWSNNWLLQHNKQLMEEKKLNEILARRAEATWIEAVRQRDEADRQRRISDQYLYGARIRQAYESIITSQPERAQDILRNLARPIRPNIPREFAWHYLWRRSRRDVIVLTESSEQVVQFALSDDGKTLATHHHDGTILLRESATGETRVKLSRPHTPITYLAISGDGQRVATGTVFPNRGNWEFALWHAATGDRLDHRVIPGALAGGISFDASGRYLWVDGISNSAGAPWHSEVWDLGDVAHQPYPRSLGVRLAMSRDRHLAVVKANDGQPLLLDLWMGTTRPFPKTDRPLSLAAISPDGRLLAGQEQGSRDLIVWDAATSWEQARFEPMIVGQMTGVVFSNDNRTLAIRDDRGGFTTHDVVTGRNIAYPGAARESQPFESSQLVFSPDGRTLALAFMPVGHPPEAPRLHDVETGELLRKYPGRNDRSGSLVYHPDGRSIFFGGRGQVYRWIIEPSPEPPQPRGHSDEAWCAAFSQDGQFLVTGSDDTDEPLTLKVWDTRTGAFVRGWKPHGATVSSLAISPDGQILATASLEQKGNLCLWDLASGRLIADLDGHQGAVRTVAFSPDGRTLASAGEDAMIRLWDPSTAKSLGVLEGHTSKIRQVAFSPDGNWIASVGNDKTLRLWNSKTLAMHRAWPGAYNLAAVIFAPDGKTLATADAIGHVDIRDVETGEILLTIDSDDEELITLAFSPDGRTLASAGRSNIIRLWDPMTGQELAHLEDHHAQVNALVFSPNGKILASCSHDGEVRLSRGE